MALVSGLHVRFLILWNLDEFEGEKISFRGGSEGSGSPFPNFHTVIGQSEGCALNLEQDAVRAYIWASMY